MELSCLFFLQTQVKLPIIRFGGDQGAVAILNKCSQINGTGLFRSILNHSQLSLDS